MTTAVLLPAAGRGERLGAARPKALHLLCGEPLVLHAVRAARAACPDAAVVVAAPPAELEEVRDLLAVHGCVVVAGGPTRQASVVRALGELDDGVRHVLVHDAARALTPPEVFRRVLERLAAGAVAVVPVVPVADTIKTVEHGVVTGTPDRSGLRAVQTPQGFHRDVLHDAHAAATGEATDDAGLVERLGLSVHTVEGSAEGFKVTTAYDVLLAEAVLRARG